MILAAATVPTPAHFLFFWWSFDCPMTLHIPDTNLSLSLSLFLLNYWPTLQQGLTSPCRRPFKGIKKQEMACGSKWLYAILKTNFSSTPFPVVGYGWNTQMDAPPTVSSLNRRKIGFVFLQIKEGNLGLPWVILWMIMTKDGYCPEKCGSCLNHELNQTRRFCYF